MKTPTNGGGMVDFKNNLIFESEKNNPIKNASEFKTRVYKKYNYKGSTWGIYRNIINYQIKTFGAVLDKYVVMYNQEEKSKFNRDYNRRKYNKRKGRKSDEKQGF